MVVLQQMALLERLILAVVVVVKDLLLLELQALAVQAS